MSAVKLNFFFRTQPMNNKKLDAVQVWKQMEDLLAPQLNFSVIDRAVYSHLFRHSRLERKLRFRFSMSWLARHIRLCEKTTRESVRRLFPQALFRWADHISQPPNAVRSHLP